MKKTFHNVSVALDGKMVGTADIVINGTMLDYKTTNKPKILTDREVVQFT